MEGEETTSQAGSHGDQNCEWEQDKTHKNYRSTEKNYKRKTTAMTVFEKLENMNEDNFWCLFKCLGGIGAVGMGGILALIALVKLALPVAGFCTVGITAGSLAAKLMALYGAKVSAGSLVAILQSVGAAGIGWNAILSALFGGSAVMAAVQEGCSYCLDKS